MSGSDHTPELGESVEAVKPLCALEAGPLAAVAARPEDLSAAKALLARLQDAACNALGDVHHLIFAIYLENALLAAERFPVAV